MRRDASWTAAHRFLARSRASGPERTMIGWTANRAVGRLEDRRRYRRHLHRFLRAGDPARPDRLAQGADHAGRSGRRTHDRARPAGRARGAATRRPSAASSMAPRSGINTIIQRKGAPLALITNAGFEDVIELARLRMPEMYSLFCHRPDPLIAARHDLRHPRPACAPTAARPWHPTWPRWPRRSRRRRRAGAEGIIVALPARLARRRAGSGGEGRDRARSRPSSSSSPRPRSGR